MISDYLCPQIYVSEEDIVKKETAQLSSTEYLRAMKMATLHNLDELKCVEKEEEMFLKEDQENLERRKAYFKRESK